MSLGRILDQPLIWETSRRGLDLVFGLYRHRRQKMRDWGVLKNDPSVLDVGCGIGSYSTLTRARYLGVDMQPRYIEHARTRNQRPGCEFRCAPVESVLEERTKFDLVLMVDFLHHLSEATCQDLLRTCSRLADQFVVSFEPITYQPHWLGRWIVEHDRGDYVRPLEELHALFAPSGLEIVESSELRLGPINTRAILARPTRANSA